jgi:signal transduction histidine kinase/DNA-binding response OmpR family regulator
MGGADGDVPPPAPLDDALQREITVHRDRRTLAVTASRLEADELRREHGEGIVWTVRDVSERARLEQLKSEFVATASHELRSPLTSIKGFVELLTASKGLDRRQREFLDIVLVSTNRLVDLVNDLLDVARVEAGRIEIHRRPTDLGEAVEEVAALMGPRIEHKNQTLEVDVPEELPRALADPSRVRQILTNLLTNAHLYTPEGGRLGVTVAAEESALRLEVSDTGRGMTPEELEHVYERFYRGTDGAATPGTGLGLSIVRSLVDLHAGSIDVASAPGEGTTFTVRIPRAAVPDEQLTASRLALRGKRVLVVDDEPEIARLIATHLEPFEVDATIVNSGAEALDMLRSERFDAVTLDILMPGMSGFEVLRAVRADPELQRTPIVVVSVFSGREALAGEVVVSKPIDADELVDSLGSAVLAGRTRVLVVGRPIMRERLVPALERLGIEHDWAESGTVAARLCEERRFEVALVDAGVRSPQAVLQALDLRGRRLRRAVVVFSAGEDAPGLARLDAQPVAVEDAAAAVLEALGDATVESAD